MKNLTDPEMRADLLQEINQLWEKSSRFSNLELDKFVVVSDWYHFALMELTLLDNFRDDPDWIADRLGITRYEAEIALGRLLRLKLIEKNFKGKIQKTKDCQLGDIPSSAIRKFHAQMIQKAQSSIKEQDFNRRDINSNTAK